MINNYLKIALRNIWRERGYATLNVLGLATGIAVCVLIFSYIRFETSFDAFHEKADQIVRIAGESSVQTPYPLARALHESVPGVDETVRISIRGSAGVKVTQGSTSFYEDNIRYADSTFFEVFSFPLKRGDPSTVLNRPFTIVLTASMAEKYFGNTDPIGKVLTIDHYGQHEYEVVGIAEEVPANSHIQFGAVSSFSTLSAIYPSPENFSSWNYWGPLTYVLLEPGLSPDRLKPRLDQVVAARDEKETASRLQTQPLRSIHLHSHLDHEIGTPGDPSQLYIFGTLAVLVLLLACVNYVNLAIARATRRASEVGIRKAVGGSQSQLARQFLGEAVVVGVLAGLVGFGLVQLGLPLLSEITRIPASSLPATGIESLLITGVGGLLVGGVSGGYPAFVLAGMDPASVLRGQGSATGRSGTLRKGLVVFQFAISVVFIAATLIIRAQIGHMQSEELGLHEEQVVTVSVRDAVRGEYRTFKQELLQQASIQGVTAANLALPFAGKMGGGFQPEGMSREEFLERHREGSLVVNQLMIEPDFTNVMEIPVVRGRPLEMEFADDPEFTPVLINQTAAAEFGWDDPIGKTFPCCFRPNPEVVGVVQDFHYRSLETEIQPLVLMKRTGNWLGQVYVRFQGEDVAQVISGLQTVWDHFGGGTPLEYSFLDDRFRQAYESQRRLAEVSSLFSVIAIILAGMGLFGLATYSVNRRTKEISIRKVLGATTERVVALVSGDFLKLVGIGLAVGLPVALIVMNRWLENFAYRIDLSPLHFLGAGGLVLLVAIFAIGYQSITAALLNPAESLRYE